MIFLSVMVYQNSSLMLTTVNELQVMLQVSLVKITSQLPELDRWYFKEKVELFGTDCEVLVLEAEKCKCPRCWAYTAEKNGELCKRCFDVLSAKHSKCK